MSKKKTIQKIIIFLSIILLVQSSVLTVVPAAKTVNIRGFDKGPAYTNVVPMEKVTFVNFDEDSYVDDYAYLAAVPTAVFKDQSADRIFSNPLLFYQDKMNIEDEKERTLDAYEGIEYFMEDWMSYCNEKLDKMTLINVPEDKVDQWKTSDLTTIDSDDIYEIAEKLALDEWSYSDDAVIAVVGEDFEKPDNSVSGKMTGKIEPSSIKKAHFEVPQTNQLNPQYKEFEVPDGYKYIKAKTTFACIEYMVFPFTWIVLPSGDKDMQLYCRYDGDWMQVAACSTNTNQWGMDPEAERASSYIYQPGDWRVGITDVPTEGIEKHGTWGEILTNMIKGVVYNVDVELYPGTELDIPDKPMFETNNVNLKLTWDDESVKLGFSLIGPGGEEIISASNESRSYQELNLNELGECLEDESYSICVFTMDEVNREIDFEIEYSWDQRISEEEGDALTSATEGAVVASVLNAPLLYTSSSELTEGTIDVLYKLGVENVYLVDIGKHLSDGVKSQIERICNVKEDYSKADDVYQFIFDETNQNDIVFTTIDPWSYWYVGENEPAGEKEKALFIGPAAYCAAVHGASVMIVDHHPSLSSAVTWHNDFWNRYAKQRVDYHPSVSEMYLTGRRVYDFIDSQNLDREGMETIITVADHFDIGMSWDRAFAGVATPGRILGSPTDTAYWISRNTFYPALIYMNPALSEQGVSLINGSISHRRSILPWGKGGLKIDRQSGEENFVYPILYTFTGYMHRFNEMAEKYYGFKYQTADEIIPGETNSLNPIDDGVNLKYTGEAGSFYPDITTTEIAPLYASRGGFSNAFSTSFDATMNNLNQGAIIWIRSGHGTNAGGGGTTFWEPANPESNSFKLAGATKEENPWRGYDWYLGSTEDPDTMTMDVHGVIPALLGNSNMDGILRTGVDWAPANHPILDKLGKIFSLPILKRIPGLDWLRDEDDYRDGMIQSVFLSNFGYVKYHGEEVDDALENIHSCGVMMGDCQPAGTLYHLALVRHGSSFQIIDPWPTSWYSGVWEQSVPRDIVLGGTVGEAYVAGISKVGILYITDPPQWWWDLMENVCYYGDPDLRVFVPGTDYSDENYWTKDETKPLRYDEEINIDGHMPFGAVEYPNEKQPMLLEPYQIAIILATIVIIAVAFVYYRKKKK